ncbi:UNVERIFIED_CONTAM: amidase family protein, partial [Bacteroidetes bacterium 56_B9]
MAALTGTPVVTVPVGFSPATETAPEGVPIGMEILGLPWTDKELLKIAWQIENKLGRVRRSPIWALEVVESKDYERVPIVEPNVDD